MPCKVWPLGKRAIGVNGVLVFLREPRTFRVSKTGRRSTDRTFGVDILVSICYNITRKRSGPPGNSALRGNPGLDVVRGAFFFYVYLVAISINNFVQIEAVGRIRADNRRDIRPLPANIYRRSEDICIIPSPLPVRLIIYLLPILYDIWHGRKCNGFGATLCHAPCRL